MALPEERGKIKISTVGRLNKLKQISGFTLIELIVVISIVSILLLFSFPVLKNIDLFSNSANQVGDIVRLINDLKKRAIEKDLDFILHLNAGSGKLWVTDASMDDEAVEGAKETGVLLSEDLVILDVEFPGIKKADGDYQIRFRSQGYSDFALIHIIAEEINFTLKIEPFLSQIQLLDTHVYLEDCI
jgi:prepilin-type N-terminal cleavage/methylation domain-containing protein